MDFKLRDEMTANELVELNQKQFRHHRARYFKGFDAWEKIIIREVIDKLNQLITHLDIGVAPIIVDSTIMDWYDTMKNFPTLITDTTVPEDYPAIPETIKDFTDNKH